jgi:hypothetical protein
MLFCLSSFCVLCPMLPVFLDCPLLIVPLVNVYSVLLAKKTDLLTVEDDIEYNSPWVGSYLYAIRSDCRHVNSTTI